jgi:hypothetical protein
MKRFAVLALLALSAGCATPKPVPVSPPPELPKPKQLTDADIVALAPANPTFNKDVAPILHQHCANCHHPGEVAPFSLLSYEDSAKRAEQIVRVTGNRFMPPWKPVAHYGEFRDARGLTDEQLATLAAWAKAGAPRGEGEEPAPPKFTEGWELGPPDVVIKMPAQFTVPAEGDDIYRCFVIPFGFTEDKEISAVAFRPGNRKVVHHMLTFIDTKGAARKRDESDPGPGYKSFGGPGFQPQGGLGGWAPGAAARFLPEDLARKVPKGADLVLQMHYHPSGKEETDVSEVGLYFAKKPAKKGVYQFPLAQVGLKIPPGAKRHREYVSFTLPIDLEVIGVGPHMHLLGQEMRVWAALPDGTDKPLIWINDWDFGWQGEYRFKQPFTLPKGSRLQIEAIYDNSDENPYNPNHPPKEVTWGEATTEEMALSFIFFASPNPEDRVTIMRELVSQLQLWKFMRELNR